MGSLHRTAMAGQAEGYCHDHTGVVFSGSMVHFVTSFRLSDAVKADKHLVKMAERSTGLRHAVARRMIQPDAS